MTSVVDPTALPWRTHDDHVEWPSAVDGSPVVFDASGVAHIDEGGAEHRVHWSHIDEVIVDLPTSRPWQHRTNTVLSAVLPKSYEYAPMSTSLGVVAKGTLAIDVWDLGRPRRFAWRLDFVLKELFATLRHAHRLSDVGIPGVLDRVAVDVVPTVSAGTRALVRTDLPGLSRFIGGHGAYDLPVRDAVAAASGRPFSE